MDSGRLCQFDEPAYLMKKPAAEGKRPFKKSNPLSTGYNDSDEEESQAPQQYDFFLKKITSFNFLQIYKYARVCILRLCISGVRVYEIQE